MPIKTVRISHLSEAELPEDDYARLVVREHPEFTDLPVTLEVHPDDIEDQLEGQAGQFVGLDYYAPGERSPRRVILPLADFNSLAKAKDMDQILADAIAEERRAREPRSRGRPRRGDGAPARARVDYSDPAHAGEPHRGRATEAEREYVRNHLDEVNQRLASQGLRQIDPNDKRMRTRYGLESPASSTSAS